MRCITLMILSLSTVCVAHAKVDNVVVADSATHIPLPHATIYDRHGAAIGMSDNNGMLPRIALTSYPITLRYIGYNDKSVAKASGDTIFLSKEVSELQEVVLESRKRPMLHLLAYVRECSTLATYTDTVFLFREKMVDYMIPTDDKVRFRGWTTPRVLTCKSYYQFTNQAGLDSVSDTSHHHFSWSDWMGVPQMSTLPLKLRSVGIASDTISGKYSPSEIWERQSDLVNINVDVLADTTSRKWVSNLKGFFRSNLDFEKFKVSYNYSNIIGDAVSACDLTGYSFNIESRGRGHNMFMFNRTNEPFFVSTDARVFILDKEYITLKEAKKWSSEKFDVNEIGIYEPLDAPPLSQRLLSLTERVNSIDRDDIKLSITPDHRLVSDKLGRRNFKIGNRALSLLKDLTGISSFKHRRKQKSDWRNFRIDQMNKNNNNTEH